MYLGIVQLSGQSIVKYQDYDSTDSTVTINNGKITEDVK